jgi:hypothetical protein
LKREMPAHAASEGRGQSNSATVGSQERGGGLVSSRNFHPVLDAAVRRPRCSPVGVRV